MTWTYKGKTFTENIDDLAGFVYVITEIETGIKYIGKKQFWKKVTRPPLKGKKRRRITRKESDWKSYYGSSDKVKELLKKNGPKAFKREIIHLCKTLGEMSYRELQEQVDNKVLFTDEYYNGIIQCRISSSHVKGFEP